MCFLLMENAKWIYFNIINRFILDMEKIMKLGLLAAFAAVFVACSGSDDDKSGIDTSTRTISVGDSVKIDGAQTLVSADKFVAYANNQGYIKAFHVGQTTVTVNGSTKIPVVVKGVQTGFSDPVTVWGCSKSYVKQHHTVGSLYKEDEDYVTYKSNGNIQAFLYSFEDSKLKAATTAVSLSNAVDYATYLSERYLPIDETDGIYMFVDALSTSTCKTVVGFGYQSGHYMAVFMDASSISSSSSAKTQTRGILLDEGVLQKLKAAWNEAKNKMVE